MGGQFVAVPKLIGSIFISSFEFSYFEKSSSKSSYFLKFKLCSQWSLTMGGVREQYC